MLYLPLGQVIDWRMVICDVVAKVVRTGCPDVSKLAL